MKREKEQDIVLLQDDIQLQQNKYVNDLKILETRNSSLVQQRVQAFEMAKFCKEMNDQEGLLENIRKRKLFTESYPNSTHQSRSKHEL